MSGSDGVGALSFSDCERVVVMYICVGGCSRAHEWMLVRATHRALVGLTFLMASQSSEGVSFTSTAGSQAATSSLPSPHSNATL
jgi:hypothetical protein